MKKLDELKQVPIVEIAGACGFTVKKIGARYYTLKEHDSVRIDPIKNVYMQNSTGCGGSVIDFLMNFNGLSLAEAIRYLEKREGGSRPCRPVEKKRAGSTLCLPERADNMRAVFAYLIKKRKIAPPVVSYFAKRKLLYQDKRRNCVFVSYKDAKPVFACFRGTGEKRFLGDVPGNDYTYDFYIPNQSKKLIITESVIDAMSIMTLFLEEEKSFTDYDYLALTGTQKYEEALRYHLSNAAYEKVLLCLDADEAGRKAAADIAAFIHAFSAEISVKRKPPADGKDFNEYLQMLKK